MLVATGEADQGDTREGILQSHSLMGEAVPFLLKEGLAAVMNRYNQREAPSP